MIRSVFEAMDTMPLGSTCPKVEPGMEQDDDESPSVTMVGQDDYATSLSSYLDGTSASWLNQTHIDAWPTGLWSPPQSANADLAEINNLCHVPFGEHLYSKAMYDYTVTGDSSPDSTRSVDDSECAGFPDTAVPYSLDDSHPRAGSDMIGQSDLLTPAAPREKRPLALVEASDCSGAGPTDDTPKRKSTKTKQGENPPLACPFQKHDPIRYRDCLKLKLLRIKDVKQHLRRRHKQPDYYCSRCYTIFDESQQRDEHTRLALCEKKPMPNFGGITAKQDKELCANADRTLGVEKQWFQVWDTVFPGQRKPQSAFLNNYTEETVSLLRETWNKRRSEILDCLSGRTTVNFPEAAADDLVNMLLDFFQKENAWALNDSSAWSALSGPNAPSVSNDGIGHRNAGQLTQHVLEDFIFAPE